MKNRDKPQQPTDPLWRDWLLAAGDETLLAEVKRQTFRASGAGGQKRNKTSNAVRISHEGLAIAAECSDSRSQADNQRVALRRFRLKLALGVRLPLPENHTERLAPLTQASYPSKKQQRELGYAQVVAIFFDLLAVSSWRVSDVAKTIGISTTRAGRFITNDHELLTEMNRQRERIGLKPIRG